MSQVKTPTSPKAARSNPEGRRLRLGMVGGGEGAYIGGSHRFAARLDDQYELVAGAFDADPARGHTFAAKNFISSDRSYDNFEQMVAAEAARPDGVDVVTICTPNFTHYPIAKACLEAGIDVICEKPLTATLEDAVAFNALAEQTGRFVGVTYTYSGYPMVQEARARVARGDLGQIRVVQVEYPLEWMATKLEVQGNQQAIWRTDLKKNGRGGSISDIGTHAYHLAGYVTGLKVEAIASDLATFIEGRKIDDNAHVMIRYEGGARGLLWSSNVAIGHSNSLRLRVFGEKGSLAWSQEFPNELVFTPLFGTPITIKRGREDLTDATRSRVRTPPGHPEGYLEAFANLYNGFAEAIRARANGREPGFVGQGLPTVYDGLKGVAFIEAVVDCHERVPFGWLKPQFV